MVRCGDPTCHSQHTYQCVCVSTRLRVHPPDILGTRTVVHYGLFERCELQVIRIPGGGSSGHIDYTSYSCRPFPQRKLDGCEDEFRNVCALWSSAAYVAVISAALGVTAALGLIFGVTTRSRRRRVWKAVVALVGWHGEWKVMSALRNLNGSKPNIFSHVRGCDFRLDHAPIPA